VPAQAGFELELDHRAPHPTQLEKTAAAIETEHPERETERILLARYAPACVLITEDLNILYFNGDTSHFLEHARGPASLNLSKLVRPGLLIELSNLIREARETNAPVRKEQLRIQVPGAIAEVNLEAIPVKLRDADTRLYLIVFERNPQTPTLKIPTLLARWLTRYGRGPLLSDREKDDRIRQLEHELEANGAFLQDAIEKHETTSERLRTANEEALSANEEMQSVNEELETAKEELQSTNEELVTTNEELLNRNRELSESIDALGESRDYLGAIIEVVPNAAKTRKNVSTTSATNAAVRL
jgi:two-component system CheB/CheR fusion protein